MTTNLNRSQSKTRDRHSTGTTTRRSSSRPSSSASEGGSSSADEIRETVKEAVGKGVAAVAGAVEGIDETMQETHLADTAESAVRQVGETATKVVRAAKEETSNLKSALRGEGDAQSGSGDSAESEDDWSTERDDPTFGTSATEANTSGSPLRSGALDEDEGESKPF